MRGRAKSALTRIINSFWEHLNKTELLSRTERHDNIFKDFDHNDAMLPEEQSESEEFEEKYFDIKVKHLSAVDELNSSSIVNSSSLFSENCSTNNFKLPRLNIPKFSGKNTDWLAFKDLYVASVHNNKSQANVQKFQYLIGLLVECPASIIKHIPVSDTTYKEAWNKLLIRFDRRNQIVTSFIKTFLNQPSVSHANCASLR
ncbi:uncharacterized protein NPIL_601381 [Nephila pilipes]|uniref:Uncharacterized protein n=1 Tax=Nephila pilipes TaxID=299642 RepID=A0A8X6QSE7_NEPPI|nr:uncharacterized protein NPIL_601381 [Nephila pilipes]